MKGCSYIVTDIMRDSIESLFINYIKYIGTDNFSFFFCLGDLYHAEKENTKIANEENIQAMENPRDDFVTRKI